ncbi:phosphotransferase [Metabacillus sp. KIGAM252]|uniref:Phosphotransferase n=1 Tax=Metabacillus flavus TaxID=2823519 RepID=A0ABS5LCT6_9BACI|nr:phosphotransferase [Metabacillus flavus]MBS2968560.1 phosphotransferase [Metabacillus flavus]
MEPSVRKQFNEEIIKKSAHFFGAESVNAAKLGDAENFVYEVQLNGSPVILRITHSSHRSLEQLQAEMDWIEFLHTKNIHVCRPISSNGTSIHVIPIESGTEFYCCLFEKAIGDRIAADGPKWNEPLFFEWGRTIGKMHNASSEYEPASGKPRRPQWHEEELLDIQRFVPDVSDEILQQKNNLLQQLSVLKKDHFGLIHSDLHTGNFHVDREELYLFDFDDSSYHWFASDVAIPLYYYAWTMERNGEQNPEEKCIRFFKGFIKGYKEERCFTEEMAKSISLFLKLRDFVLYAFFMKKFGAGEIEETYQNWIVPIKHRIEDDREIISIK